MCMVFYGLLLAFLWSRIGCATCSTYSTAHFHVVVGGGNESHRDERGSGSRRTGWIQGRNVRLSTSSGWSQQNPTVPNEAKPNMNHILHTGMAAGSLEHP